METLIALITGFILGFIIYPIWTKDEHHEEDIDASHPDAD